MGKLTDRQIKGWIKAGEHFEARSDGAGLYIRFPTSFKIPSWRFRYSIAGKRRVLDFGSYEKISLKQARDLTKQLNAEVALGQDPASERKKRKRAALKKIDDQQNTCSKLAEMYISRYVDGKIKHPELVTRRFHKDLLSVIGKLQPKEVGPEHVDQIIQSVLDRGAPTTANKCLQLGKQLFNLAVKHRMVKYNIFASFTVADAGGKEKPRDRWLTEAELKQLLDILPKTKGLSIENQIAIRLLLMLAVRKMQLIGARKDEFDLDNAVWHLPKDRTKTEAAIEIPLPHQAVELLEKLFILSGKSDYLFPAKKSQTRLLPHISPDTVNAALGKYVRPLLDMEKFTIHDLRRTAKTHLGALGFPPHISEACLNHVVSGVAGVYDQYDYCAERKAALQALADRITSIESGMDNVVPLRGVK